MRDFEQIEDQYGLSLFQKRGITLVKGKNALVWDKEGKEYIDCTAGHGVAGIGHANDDLVAALTSQAAKLITCTGSFYNEERAKLMQKLVEISPKGLEKVFLCTSGTESVEAAIKFARISTGKTDFICTRDAGILRCRKFSGKGVFDRQRNIDGVLYDLTTRDQYQTNRLL